MKCKLICSDRKQSNGCPGMGVVCNGVGRPRSDYKGPHWKTLCQRVIGSNCYVHYLHSSEESTDAYICKNPSNIIL